MGRPSCTGFFLCNVEKVFVTEDYAQLGLGRARPNFSRRIRSRLVGRFVHHRQHRVLPSSCRKTVEAPRICRLHSRDRNMGSTPRGKESCPVRLGMRIAAFPCHFFSTGTDLNEPPRFLEPGYVRLVNQPGKAFAGHLIQRSRAKRCYESNSY